MNDIDITPPLPALVLLHFLVAVGALLLTAKLFGVLARKARMPSVVGELGAGVVLGPSLLGNVAPDVSNWLFPREPEKAFMLDGIAQFGLLLLVAFTGTQLDRGLVRRQGRAAMAVSVSGLVIPLLLGIALGFVVAAQISPAVGPGQDLAPWLFGVAMSVSAIPVIAKTLADMDLLHRNVGQLTLTAGMIDDAVGWLMLSAVSAAAVAGFSLQLIGLSVLTMGLFVLLAVALGRPLARVVLGAAAQDGSTGRYVAICVIAVVGSAALSQALHLEAIFGAFVAGVVLASADAEIHTRLASLRVVTLSVLAPLFLAMAGLRVDLTHLADGGIAAVALASIGVAVVGKFAGVFLGAGLAGLTRWECLAVGAGMNARGVVEIIVALTGLRLGIINVAGYTVIVLVAIVTSMMAPPLLRFAATRIEVTDEERARKTEPAS